MSTSKLLPPEQLGSYEKWRLPEVVEKEGSSGRFPTAKRIEEIEKAASEEGYREGYNKGLAQGMLDAQAKIKDRCQRLEQILNFLNQPLNDINEDVPEQLLHLSMSVARQIIRREIKQDPGQIVAVVREAMGSLPVSARTVNIFLHPDDVSMVHDALSPGEQGDTENTWHLLEDPVLTRGGCRVQAGHSNIDASIETRLNRIITTMLGGERDTDSQDEND